MRRLMDLAHAHGLHVEWAPLGDEVRGYYEHPVRTITLNTALPHDLLRSAFAHELGHAWYGHAFVPDRRLAERHELLADRYAADLLITPDAYARAEALVGPHRGALALELSCDVDLVGVYQDALEVRRPPLTRRHA